MRLDDTVANFALQLQRPILIHMSSSAPSYREKPPKLIGGEVCLDFINTVSWRGDPHDYGERLTTYAELLLWALHVGILDSAASRRLRQSARRRPTAARAVVDRAIELREALARLLFAAKRPATSDVAIVNAVLSSAPARSAMVVRDRRCAWTDRINRDSL